MEPIDELEDDEGFDFESSGIHLSDSPNTTQFRSRANTWPQFNALTCEDSVCDPNEEDSQKLSSKLDICTGTYSSRYEQSYQTLQGQKGLHESIERVTGLYSAHLNSNDFAVSLPHSSSRETLNTTSLSENLHNGQQATYYSTPNSTHDSADNGFSSRTESHKTCQPHETNGTHQYLQHRTVTESTSKTINSSNGSIGGNGNGSSVTSVSNNTTNSHLAASNSVKKNTSRRNAWGNMSYADLITQAINGSPDKRLTLSQIYEWMVQNVTYFKDKGDSNSSAGWKVGGHNHFTFMNINLLLFCGL